MILRTGYHLSEGRTKSVLMLSFFIIGVHPAFADQALEGLPETQYAPIEARCCEVATDIEQTSFWHASLSPNFPFIQSQLSLFTGLGPQLETTAIGPTSGFIENYRIWDHKSPIFFEAGASSATKSGPEYYFLAVKFIGEIDFLRGTNPEKRGDTGFVSFTPAIGLNYSHVRENKTQSSISASLELPYRSHLTQSEFNIDVNFRF